MKPYIFMFVEECPSFQRVMDEHIKPACLTQQVEIPTWKWEVIDMDFVVGLTRRRKMHNSIWFIIERMSKYGHFIRVKSTYRAEDFAKLYIDEIVRWHVIRLAII